MKSVAVPCKHHPDGKHRMVDHGDPYTNYPRTLWTGKRHIPNPDLPGILWRWRCECDESARGYVLDTSDLV